MKQETSEATPQILTPEKKYDVEVLGVKHFYNLFIDESKKRKNPTLSQFKKIISTYLNIYFHELYFIREPKYFFLGGRMKLVKYLTWMRVQRRGTSLKKETHIAKEALGFFWFLRPTPKYHYMVKIKKLTGKLNQVPKIEQKFNQNLNKDLLPIFGEEQKKGIKNKTLYRCIQT